MPGFAQIYATLFACAYADTIGTGIILSMKGHLSYSYMLGRYCKKSTKWTIDWTAQTLLGLKKYELAWSGWVKLFWSKDVRQKYPVRKDP